MHSPETSQIIDRLKAGRIQEFIELAYKLRGLNLPALDKYLREGVLTNTPELIKFCNSLPPNLDHETPDSNTHLTKAQIGFLIRLQAVLTNSELKEENINQESTPPTINNIAEYLENLPPYIDLLKLLQSIFSTNSSNLDNIPPDIIQTLNHNKESLYKHIQNIIESHLLLLSEFKNFPAKRRIGKIICQKLINELQGERDSGAFISENTDDHLAQKYHKTYQTLLTLIPLLNEENKHNIQSTIQNLLNFFETYQNHSSKSYQETWNRSQQITEEIPELPQIKVD